MSGTLGSQLGTNLIQEPRELGTDLIGWTPAALGSTVKLWAHAGAGVRNDGSGYCDQLTEQGPLGYVFTQVTGSSRPLISSLNGRPSLLLDGTDDSMGCTSASSEWTVMHDGTAMHTFCVVAQTGSASKHSPWLATCDITAPTTSAGIVLSSYATAIEDIGYYIQNGSGVRPVDSNTGTTVTNAWMLLEWRIDSGGATKWLSAINGTTVGSSASFANTLASGAPAATLRIGRDRGTASVKAQGHWGESLICIGVQTGATLAQIKSYFAGKYGITVA